MSISPNKPKRARKAQNLDKQTNGSLTTDGENIFTESNENKWKRRLHSLRRSLTKKRIHNPKEYQGTKARNEGNFGTYDADVDDKRASDVHCDNGVRSVPSNVTNGCKFGSKSTSSTSTISSEKCSPNGVSTLEDSIACNNNNNKGTIKKRKRFGRRTKGTTARGNKDLSASQPIPSQQHLQNGQISATVEPDESVERRGKNKNANRKNTKSMLIFPSWFKSLGRSSGKKLKNRGLSVSTGNFNEREHNFKLLTDVRLLRDPGYISSSADSLDCDATNEVEEKYNSLRRSRASLIDIRWPKHGRSVSNLTSPISLRSKSPSLTLGKSSRGHSSQNVSGHSHASDMLLCNNNCNKTAGISKRASTGTETMGLEIHVSKETCAQKASLTLYSCCDFDNCKTREQRERRGCENLDEDDVYLTAEEDITHDQQSSSNYNESTDKHFVIINNILDSDLDKNIGQDSGGILLKDNHPTKKQRRASSSVSPPFGTSLRHTQRKCDNLETEINNVSPCLNKMPKILSQSQPLRILPSSPQDPMESHLCSGNMSCFDTVCRRNRAMSVEPNVTNGRKLTLGQINDMRSSNSPTKVLSPTDSCYDVVFTRPPKKPAPKPPSQMKSRSQSLTALGVKFPVLSDQLHLNESSSVHKLNDSCGENLCELLSQSKNRSNSSEGVYVGIIGDQGVVLRKKRTLPKPKRVFSMPVELLENVMEVEVSSETSNLSSVDGSHSSEISSSFLLQSSESEVYLSCSSNSPSPVVMDSVKKGICVRSISISSIEVQELSTQKRRVFSQSFPCLTLNKDFSARSPQGLNHDGSLEIFDGNAKPCTAQSMVSLDQQDTFDGHGNTNEKVTGKPLIYAEALWDHVTMNEKELCFTAGQAIAVYDIDDPEWWFGLLDDHIGWFPAAFVRIPVSSDLWIKYQNSVGMELDNQNNGYQFCGSENSSDICLSRSDIRGKIVEEIINTEQDYVQNLKNIVEGYLKQARRRPDMFSDKLLGTIFSNIEIIYHFHVGFLQSVRDQCGQEKSNFGKIGEVFVKNRQNFCLYSEYCNNHPRASFELKNLLQQDKYRYFFEACRLLQDMIRISLDGFLLAPVQKICKYPLQLQELLKYTDPEDNDYSNVKKALETMREVASSINEEKRKVDNIKKIAEWQLSIEQWEGEDVLEKSSQLVHSGDVIKMSKGKAQGITLFLFDHQLVFCKKDVLKKHSFEYKGRIVLKNYDFKKLEDGEVTHNGTAVTNAWQLLHKQGNSSCLFQVKTSEQRDKWIKYFLQERAIVYEATSGNSIPLDERRAAMGAAKCALKSEKHTAKDEKKYGRFNTVSRAIGQLHYGSVAAQQQKIGLPPPVSSATLLQRNQTARSSFGVIRTSGVFKKKRHKPRRQPTQLESI